MESCCSLLHSLTSTATLSPELINFSPRTSASVDLPAPGGPDNPTRTVGRSLPSACCLFLCASTCERSHCACLCFIGCLDSTRGVGGRERGGREGGREEGGREEGGRGKESGGRDRGREEGGRERGGRDRGGGGGREGEEGEGERRGRERGGREGERRER